MKTDTLYNQLKKYTQKFLLVFSCLLALIVGWSGNGINLANAATGGNNIPLIADFDPSGIRNQIEGKTKEIEGRTQKDLGKAESKFDEAAKTANRKADEATAELKKNTQDSIKESEKALEKAGNQTQDTGEGVIDSIKEFFNK